MVTGTRKQLVDGHGVGVMVAAAVLIGLFVTGFGSSGSGAQANAGGPPASPVVFTSDAPEVWSGQTRNVPDDYPTVQSAVDAADPGDLVLIEPGVYNEAVSVTTPGLVIRGTDRNRVILDGEFTRSNGIFVTADGVAIENITARNYVTNGFYWDGVTGYRGSYLTAIDDWVYGIYAFDSVDGLFEHSYASGSWDAGFYVGQCDPCNAVVTDVLAEFNGLGYSGTNSSGDMYIVNSEWRHNVGGIVPNTLDSELLAPAHDVLVAGNYIHHNGESERAPNRSAEWSSFGNGVVLAGVRDSVVRNNLMVNNASSGVEVVTMIDANLWRSGGNEVRNNTIRGSGRADLLLGGPLEQGSCFSNNDAKTSVPYFLNALHDCDGINLPLWYGLATSSDPLGRIAQAAKGENPQLEHGDAPKPRLNFDQLPDGADAEVRPAVDVFESLDFDPDEIATPDLPANVDFDDPKASIFGVVLSAGFWPVLYGALMWWIPMAVWILGGLWAVLKLWLGFVNADRSMLTAIGWTFLVVVLPVVGVLLFALLGYQGLPLGARVARLAAAIVLWLAVTAGALVWGGVF